MRILSTYVHGILDYVVGLALILAPNIFGFSELGGPAVLLPRLLGTAAILFSLLTNYEWGVLKIIPMRVHLVVDFLSGALLAASPWLFGFATEPANAWAPHVVVGVMEILVVMMSQTEPRSNLKHA
jgi:hypothetical protein